MNPRPSIGVLTFHRCINYGSYWQAHCLVQGLRARGRDAVLIEHMSAQVNHAEWRCALQPVLPTPVPRSDYPAYLLKMFNFFQAFAALPASAQFALEQPAEMERYALVVVGSDEVWNLRHPWYGAYPLFYGDGIRADRLISYAASFGNYQASQGLDAQRIEMLRRFDRISVRDENSRRIIHAALGFEPPMVLDPCLQFPPRLPGCSSDDLHPPYVAVYGHNFSAWFGREIRRWARTRGFRLVSVGYRNDWADEQWLAAGPEAFAYCMGHAAAVATNFFHGCVFALLGAKPFAVELSSYRTDKVRSLLSMIGGERHLVTAATPSDGYAAILDVPLDPMICHRIAVWRQRSHAYLDEVLD
jgi:hypothetical protein